VSATRELLVLVSATQVVQLSVRVLATQHGRQHVDHWHGLQHVDHWHGLQHVDHWHGRVWLVLVSATQVVQLSVLVSATRELLVLDHNTHPHTHHSCCMQYLLEEQPCHRGIVQAPSLC